MSDDTLSSLSATELIALYRSKQLSPVEVVTATVERIGCLNPSTTRSLSSIRTAR
jgi:Asp-tRNA(Asn)/Glu-tRNA(Gln) amidotransferase A subunit family amidase